MNNRRAKLAEKYKEKIIAIRNAARIIGGVAAVGLLFLNSQYLHAIIFPKSMSDFIAIIMYAVCLIGLGLFGFVEPGRIEPLSIPEAYRMFVYRLIIFEMIVSCLFVSIGIALILSLVFTMCHWLHFTLYGFDRVSWYVCLAGGVLLVSSWLFTLLPGVSMDTKKWKK